MNHDQVAPLLDDYIDGTLPPSERASIESHLAECERCREEVVAIRSLLAAAGTLPRDIQPRRDLWPVIDSKIRESTGTRATRPMSWTLWSVRYPLAAAAVLLIIASSAITTLILRDRRPPPTTTLPAASAESPATSALISRWQDTEDEYLRASNELLESLETMRSDLAPEVTRLIEENLKIIDAAIQESRAALELDPTNAELMEMLSATYTKKLEVLQQVTRLSATS